MNFARGNEFRAEDAVDEGSLAGAGGAEEDGGFGGFQFLLDVCEALAGDAAGDDVGRGDVEEGEGEIGLCQQDDGGGAALPGDGEVALDAPWVDVGGCGHDKGDVDVGREDLFFGLVAGLLAGEDGASFDYFSDGVVVQRDPVADAGVDALGGGAPGFYAVVDEVVGAVVGDAAGGYGG